MESLGDGGGLPGEFRLKLGDDGRLFIEPGAGFGER